MVSERLKKIEEILDILPSQMAKKGCCSQATYYRYRKGESVPDINFLNNILKNENIINPEWLLTGRGSILNDNVNPTEFPKKSQQEDQIKFVNLPLYDMRPAQSDEEGKLPMEQWSNPSKSLPLCNIFVDHIVGAKKNQLFAMRVHCDSMSPDIKPDSLVLVDKTESQLSIDGIFVIRFDDVIRMKLIQRLPNN